MFGWLKKIRRSKLTDTSAEELLDGPKETGQTNSMSLQADVNKLDTEESIQPIEADQQTSYSIAKGVPDKQNDIKDKAGSQTESGDNSADSTAEDYLAVDKQNRDIDDEASDQTRSGVVASTTKNEMLVKKKNKDIEEKPISPTDVRLKIKFSQLTRPVPYTTSMGKGIQLAKQATEADADGKWEEAIEHYKHSVEYFLHALKYEVIGNGRAKEMVTTKCETYSARAKELKKQICPKGMQQGATARNVRRREISITDIHEQKLLKGVILTEKPNVHWSDVAGLSAAKKALQELIIFPLKFPQLFKGKRSHDTGIILYGPPGTGKSLLAKAVATETPYTFFSVLSIDISREAMQSILFLNVLFKEAKARKPSIIFIDEIEILCKNSATSNDVYLVRNEFLKQIQMLENGVIVIGATNMPWALDYEFQRKFQNWIHVGMPNNIQARKQIIMRSIGTHLHFLSSQDFVHLSQKTDGYTGGDINEIVREALMMPLRKIQQATSFKQISGPSPTDEDVHCDDLWIPCGPRDPNAKEITFASLPGDKIIEPQLLKSDFERAISAVHKSVNADDLKKYNDFKISL